MQTYDASCQLKLNQSREVAIEKSLFTHLSHALLHKVEAVILKSQNNLSMSSRDTLSSS